jgi:hypothetical protein
MADMKQVLEKLAERTEESRVPWRKGDLSDTFEVSLGDLTVIILGSNKGLDGTIFLHVRDKRNETVGRAYYNPQEPEINSELVSLFERAQRIATDDPRLDDLLKALDAAPPVS